PGLYQFAQIPPRSVRLSEQILHELSRGWHVLVARRSVHRQWPLPVFKPRREDQRRKIAAVIDMKMAEEKDVHLRHLRAALAKAQSTASSSIQNDTRLAVVPYQVAGRRPLILHLRATGTQNLHSEPRSAT